ncbi:hypothetical protein DV736_g6159, partial [Chaetothyriales sp. CBS 134916]
MTALPFSKLPVGASLSSISPFTISFPDSDLKHLQDLLKLTPVPSPSYENSLPDSQRRFGIRRDWLIKAKTQWETDFDWRKVESKLNLFPQYKAKVKDQLGEFDVHFVALFSDKADAIPLFLFHGWPGSFLEFIGILTLLKERYTPATLPYHIIVPSLPGFTFTKLPADPLIGFDNPDAGRVFNTLATELLGFKSYIVQGGDIGARVARAMGTNYAACKAVHLNFCGSMPPSTSGKIKDEDVSDAEMEGLKRAEQWMATGRAYALEHATRPATIGIALSSSPVALLAWVGEKFLDWTDKDPSIQTILEAVTLYWLTHCAHTNLWAYWQTLRPDAKTVDHPSSYIHKPFGYSYFPRELMPVPIAWVRTTGDLVHVNIHTSGGHFAALEEPVTLWADVEDFIKAVWKG